MSTPQAPAQMPATAAGLAAAGSDAPSLLRHIDWIWRVRGQIELPAGLAPAAAIDRLLPLMDEPGTSHQRSGDTLAFAKKDPHAQDKLAVFDGGVLQVTEAGGAPVLRYELTSRFLLACFLAPALFFAFGHLGLAAANYQKAQMEAEEKAEKAKGEKAKAKKKDEAKELTLNPVDVFLGAPAPKTRKEIEAEKAEKKKEPPSAKPAWVFTGIFAFLYLLGRILEARLARGLFTRRLAAAD